jgi:hypothetical protein
VREAGFCDPLEEAIRTEKMGKENSQTFLDPGSHKNKRRY